MNVPLNPEYLDAVNAVEQVAEISKVIIVLKRKNQDSFGFDAREVDAEITVPVMNESLDSTIDKLYQALELNMPKDASDIDPVILIKGVNQNWSQRTVNVDPSIDAIIESVRASLTHTDNQAGLVKPAPTL